MLSPRSSFYITVSTKGATRTKVTNGDSSSTGYTSFYTVSIPSIPASGLDADPISASTVYLPRWGTFYPNNYSNSRSYRSVFRDSARNRRPLKLGMDPSDPSSTSLYNPCVEPTCEGWGSTLAPELIGGPILSSKEDPVRARNGYRPRWRHSLNTRS